MNERDLQDTKGKILGVGTFDENGWPTGWTIRGNAALVLTDDGPLFGGYTLAELQKAKADADLKRLKEAGFEVYGWVPMEADE